MYTRSFKHCKNRKKGFKTKTNDGKAEVFVLPPDLLQKLGINLGSDESYLKCPTEATINSGNLALGTAIEKSLITEVPKIASEISINKDSHRDTTILETADLMKKSVFLSPTFVTSSNDIDLGELEISNGIEIDNLNGSTIATDATNTISIQNSNTNPISERDKLPVTLNSQRSVTEIYNKNKKIVHDYEIEKSILPDSNFDSISTHENSQISYNNVVTDILKSPVLLGSTDDHSDEAYLSDCSNSNLGLSDAYSVEDYIPEKKAFEEPKEFHKKIKILSEEIISPSKLKDLRIMLSPKKSDFKPVSMNCLLRSNNLSENSEYNAPFNNNICIPKGNEQNIVVLSDEAGKFITSVSKNITQANTVNLHTNNCDITEEVINEKITPILNKIAVKTFSKFKTRTPENSFVDIDVAVIDMEIEKNEDVLEIFVNEITSNSDNKIMDKVKQNEKDCPNKTNDPEIEVNTKQDSDKNNKNKTVKSMCHNLNTKLLLLNSNKGGFSKFFKQLEENTEFLQTSEMITCNKMIETDLETRKPNISIEISNVTENRQYKDEPRNNENYIDNLCPQTELNYTEQKATKSLPESENQTKSNHSIEIFPAAANSRVLIQTEYDQPNIASSTAVEDNNESIDSDFINKKNNATQSWSKLSLLTEIKDRTHHLLKIENYMISNESKEIHNDGDYVATNKISNQVILKSNHMIAQMKEDSSLPTHKNNTKSNHEKAHVDKIKEIATYLSQFARNKSRIVKLKRKSDKNLEISLKRSKSNPLTSKLRNQGVERLGGSEKSNKENKIIKVLKTYTKSNKRSIFLSKAVTPTAIMRSLELSVAVDEQDSNCIVVREGIRKPEFCLCGDFGRLAYYDSDYPYEHIHFWEHKVDNCDRETVFSIYTNSSDSNSHTAIKEVSDFSLENSHTFVYSICWHSCMEEPVVNRKLEITKVVTEDNLPETNEKDKANEENFIFGSKQTSNKPLNTCSKLYYDCLDTKVSTTTAECLANNSHKLELNIVSFETSSKSSMNETAANDTSEDLVQPHNNAPILLEGNESMTSDDNVSKCGVCKEIVLSAEWIKHITQKHDYLAWKDGDTPFNLDIEDDVRQHLIYVVREIGQLTCSKCGISRKYPKSYMQHVQYCTGSEKLQETQEKINVNSSKTEQLKPSDVVKCAVCSKSMLESEWMQHIKEAHKYLAWRKNDQPLNTDDEESVRNHLYNISKQNDGLECIKCGCIRKYVKSYLVHIKTCQGPTISKNIISMHNSYPKIEKNSNNSAPNSMVKCGVCGKEVWSEKWLQHIGRAHNYMAWKEGESLDENNSEEVYSHLYEIIKRTGYLVCSKCGSVRKYVKPFLQHVSTCDIESPAGDYNDSHETQERNKNLVCALCYEEVDPKKWKNHKMVKHYNVAWTVGSVPVDYKNANVIDTLMREYKAKYKKMVCKVCHASRVSRVGFYAHVIACGKTEEEIDLHRNLCEICNKKYLCVYHKQHMAWHTQQELTKEKKLKAKEEENQDPVMSTLKREIVKDEEVVTGRRQAAQKARNMIENFKNVEFAYQCPECKFGSDSKKELAKHVCSGNYKYFSDSGESVNMDNYSGEESEDIVEVDSNVSDEEQSEAPKKKRKKYPAYTNIQRFSHVPQKLTAFLAEIGAEFHQHHYTNEILYSDLRVFDCEPVPSDQLVEYLPPLEESCCIRFCEDSWNTYKRFAAERKTFTHTKMPCHSMFTGGCIECISWAPPGSREGKHSRSLLAVACHNGADLPRMAIDDTAPHPGLIQLWDFGDFSQAAEFTFGVAHDYGTAWAMDWCPAGTRDVWLDDVRPAACCVLRLGLLAVAFSTGCVAVFSVPHPSTLEKREQSIQRLKSVAELRMRVDPDRKTYQATSLSWSKQKPYETILVGYGDGSTAYFDLNTESLFLKTIENNIVILYPYHDERAHSTCITGVGLYPSVSGVGGAGAACSSSRTGVALVARPGARPARQHAAIAAGNAHFQPLWPSAALTGDEANIGTSLNEIEWYGGGRRLGGGSTGAGCHHCGRYVLAATPLLRARFPHPADNLAKREILGVLQMASLIKNRNKLTNDELQTQVEPTTYDEAIKKYGVELRIDKESIEKIANKSRESCPERRPQRFPLGDVTALAFCPEVAHHRKLAVATHCGMLFVLQT